MGGQGDCGVPQKYRPPGPGAGLGCRPDSSFLLWYLREAAMKGAGPRVLLWEFSLEGPSLPLTEACNIRKF